MEDQPNGNGSKKPPIQVRFEATLAPVGILAIGRVERARQLIRQWDQLHKNAFSAALTLITIGISLVPTVFPAAAGPLLATISWVVLALCLFLLWTVPAWPARFNTPYKILAVLLIVLVSAVGQVRLYLSAQRGATALPSVAASPPKPIATPYFDGLILRAGNLVRPSWDHRVVLMGASIKDVGGASSRLSMWSVSGSDLKGGQIVYGLILQPPRPVGEKFEMRTKSGLYGTATYDNQSYLPSKADNNIKPGNSIEGLLEVEFPRQVDNLSLKIGFQDEIGNKYTIGCTNCETMP